MLVARGLRKIAWALPFPSRMFQRQILLERLIVRSLPIPATAPSHHGGIPGRLAIAVESILASGIRSPRFTSRSRNGTVEHLDIFATQLRWKIVELEVIRLGEGNCSFDEAVQLADVARPRTCASGPLRHRTTTARALLRRARK